MFHKHHIIPLHLGGSNDPSNLIELTVEEHAEAHKQLWLMDRRWQDELAYLFLSKQMKLNQLRILAVKYSLTGKPKSENHKKNLSISQKNKPKSDETKEKMRLAKLGKPNINKGKKFPQISAALIGNSNATKKPK